MTIDFFPRGRPVRPLQALLHLVSLVALMGAVLWLTAAPASAQTALGGACSRNFECASGKCQGTGNNRQCVCARSQDCTGGDKCFRPALRRNFCAPAVEINSCDATAEPEVRIAADFITTNFNELVDNRLGFLTLEQRQELTRKWQRVNLRCRDDANMCNTALGFAHGGPGNTVNVCYYRSVELANTRCDLVDTIFHEVGHANGYPSANGHNNPTDFVFRSDIIYRMGQAARALCQQQSAAGTFADALLPGVTNLAIGAACTFDTQCASDQCSSSGQCVCRNDGDCAAGQFCNNRLGQNRCLPDASLALGATCDKNRECASNKCQGSGNDRQCVCAEDGDCPGNQVCRTRVGQNQCEAGALALGQSCSRNDQCTTGKCQGSGNNRQCVCAVDSDCPGNQTCRRRVGRNQCQ